MNFKYAYYFYTIKALLIKQLCHLDFVNYKLILYPQHFLYALAHPTSATHL